MSLDRSLKTAGGMARHRNVLTRPERIAKLQGQKKFDMSTGDPLGLPKVGNRKIVTGGKKDKKEEAAPAAGAAAPAAKGAAAPAAKGGKK